MTRTVPLLKNILEANDRIAAENTETFHEHGITVVNLMGSPGAGKTSLLEMTAAKLGDTGRWAVIEGDVEGSRDAQRLQKLDVPVVQINTGGSCHLDANMVRQGLEHLDLDAIDLLFVENVGNLVCPAEFPIGEKAKVMVLSVTEGEDKPEKYPLMFRESRLMVLSKIDLMPHLDLDEEELLGSVRAVNPDLEIIRVSTRSGEGSDGWLAWLEELRR